MALAIEITDQTFCKKNWDSEKHFRQLADIIPTKISNTDKDGNIIYFNKKWLDYTGKSFDGSLKGYLVYTRWGLTLPQIFLMAAKLSS
jgi:PAS domain-containing protein